MNLISFEKSHLSPTSNRDLHNASWDDLLWILCEEAGVPPEQLMEKLVSLPDSDDLKSLVWDGLVEGL